MGVRRNKKKYNTKKDNKKIKRSQSTVSPKMKKEFTHSETTIVEEEKKDELLWSTVNRSEDSEEEEEEEEGLDNHSNHENDSVDLHLNTKLKEPVSPTADEKEIIGGEWHTIGKNSLR